MVTSDFSGVAGASKNGGKRLCMGLIHDSVIDPLALGDRRRYSAGRLNSFDVAEQAHGP